MRASGDYFRFQYCMSSKAGKPSDDLAPGRFKMKYLIVIEKTQTGYSAFSPDLDGCVATGSTRKEVEQAMKEAIEFHLEGLRQEGYNE